MSSVSTESSKTFPERTRKRVTWASDSDLVSSGSRSLETQSSEFLKSAIRVKSSVRDKISQGYEIFDQHEKSNETEKMDKSRLKFDMFIQYLW